MKQLRWEKIDDYNVRICTRSLDASESTCNASTSNPIFSNFLELISIKILPEHKIGDINLNNINSTEPTLFRSPVGTGPYVFSSVSGESITVQKFDNYHNLNFNPSISKIIFKFYKTFDSAVTALKNGEIHTLVSVSIEHLNELEEYQKIQIQKSPVISNQYWALYFNLRKDPNGRSVGPEFLQNTNVRKAIFYGINRDSIIENSLREVGEESLNTIYKGSEFFNPYSLLDADNEDEIQQTLQQGGWKYDKNKSLSYNIEKANEILSNSSLSGKVDTSSIWLLYNPAKAVQLLEKEGWLIRNGEEVRTNEKGERLEFSLYFVDNFDRNNIAKSIQEDLYRLGINVITDRRQQPGQDGAEHAPDGWGLNELNNQILAPRLFDVILYGVDTFIDPNRYELFHSSQQVHPGLNISGYSSSEQTVKPRENRKEGESSLVRVPKVDRRLEEARRYDPVSGKDDRVNDYNEVQDMILDDMPVIFLYHPQFIYYHNDKLQGVDLTSTNALEYRFRNIYQWVLSD